MEVRTQMPEPTIHIGYMLNYYNSPFSVRLPESKEMLLSGRIFDSVYREKYPFSLHNTITLAEDIRRHRIDLLS